MSTKDTLENLAKNTWLAGLGSFDSSKEALSKSIDAAQEKSNSLYNDLITRGEEIQSKINHKRDELQAKGKSLFGLGSEKSQEEKLAELNAKVDALTTAVVTLIEKRKAEEAKATKPKAAAKAKPKTTTRTASKAAPKAAAKTAPAATTATKDKVAPKVEAKTTTEEAKATTPVETKATADTTAKAE